MNTLERVELLLEKENLLKLKNACVLIVGIGGVGSYAAEALARTGIGKLILLDKDKVVASNLNRQIHATYDTINTQKTTAMKNRILQFNQDIEIREISMFYENKINDIIFNEKIDFVIDAIDTLSPKFQLIQTCLWKKIPFISSLGMGNRLDASKVKKGYLHETTYCPVAKNLRKLVKKHNILRKIPVIYSTEHPITQSKKISNSCIRKEQMPPASVILTPATAGLIAASEAVNTILKR